MSDYYTPGTAAPARSTARSPLVNSEFEAVAAGFAKLPAELALKQGRVTYATDNSVAANTILLELPTDPASYVEGLTIWFKVAQAITGAAIVNVMGPSASYLGAKSLKRYDLTDTVSGDGPAGAIACVAYDGTRFQLLWPLAGVLATAQAQALAAAASAAAAATSAGAASTSATAALASQVAAAASAAAAAASAVLAASYAGSSKRLFLGTLTGTGDAQVSAVNLAPVLDGFLVEFVSAGTNTISTPTIDDGTNSLTLADKDGNVLAAGELLAGRFYAGTYHASGSKVRLHWSAVSQAAAEAAAMNVGEMTPLRTKQQIDARVADNAAAQAGSSTTALMTPAATKAAALYQGTHTFWIDAANFRKRESGGPEIISSSAETSSNKIRIDGLAFDAASIERAIGRLGLGTSWNKGTITAKAYWRAASGSGDVVWAFRGVAIGHDDALDAAFGTAQTVTSTLTASGDLVVSSASAAITFAGTPANGDMLWLEVYRVATDSGDTLAADAILLGVEITITINAANDA